MSDQVIYGVQLLDDIHNYFPDLLYNNRRFDTVQSVLSYITSTTRNRFDLFRHGRNQYYYEEEEPILSPAAGSSPIYTPIRAHTIPSTIILPPTAAAPATQSPIFQPHPYSLFNWSLPPARTISPRFDDDLESNINLLTTLANLFPTTGNLPRSFMDPISVIPSAQQINSATAIITLESDMDDNCTICQENMHTGESVRRINACTHSFHSGCIDTWFIRNVRCPVCRHDIRDPPTPRQSPRLTAMASPPE